MNFKSIGQVVFPEPQDICINMMPFVMGDIESIPEEFRHYYPLETVDSYLKGCKLSSDKQMKYLDSIIKQNEFKKILPCKGPSSDL